MYAIVETGGKQYKVAQGDSVNIELTNVDDEAETLELDKVLLVSDGENVKIGTPYLAGARVVASFATTAKEAVIKLLKDLNMPSGLAEIGFDEGNIDELAEAGMKIQRLQTMSPVPVTLDDLKEILRQSLRNW